MSTVRLGIETLQKDHFAPLQGHRLGLVVNPGSVDSRFRSTVDIFRNADGIKPAALFGPQHGIWGETQDNMVEWEGFQDTRSSLPVHSLYGKTRKPLPAMLEGLDTLVIDLPDVGARYYTFIWTMSLCLQACRENRIACMVLDRPNPINGLSLEGPMLQPAFSSFVGLYPLPIRHGLTIGELALFFNREFGIQSDLSVIPMEGWKREMWYDQTKISWVLPSPNLPSLETATVYPGMCLLEGTNLSEGRGTTRPFEIFGAPGVDPFHLVKALAAAELAGVIFRPLYFLPTFQKYQGQVCGGAQMHVTDREVFSPVLTAVAVIRTFYQLYPGIFQWRQPPYEYETKKLPIDILVGSDSLRLQIEQGCSLEEISGSWEEGIKDFRSRRKPYLLY